CVILMIACIAGCANVPGDNDPPPAPREFRGAWVASVGNIDWPSRKGLSTAAQQAEIVRIVETAQALNLNALIVQVRPAADALYASSIEPWSEYLTGVQGKPPDPPYDPLQTWIDEAHRRGIAIHAWFNPYRARHPSATGPNAPAHIANTDPDIVKRYGDSLWMDPGESRAAQRTLAVIVDVVRRYDIDGVHIDDYFYPYPISSAGDPATEVEFPDDASWLRCVLRADCNARSRAEWRRRNVDTLIQAIHAAVHREKPWVRFGISPFGIGRPDLRPAGIEGFSQFHKLFADVERWQDEGWLDYLAPQLYWRRDDRAHAFGTLLDYWLVRNARGRHVWPGLFTSRVDDRDDARDTWKPDEIIGQIGLTRDRERASGQSGHIHFSVRALVADRQGIDAQLRERVYRDAALVPAAAWLRSESSGPSAAVAAPVARAPMVAAPVVAAPAVAAPIVERVEVIDTSAGPALSITLHNLPQDTVRQYAAWIRAGGTWRFAVSAIIDSPRTGTTVAVNDGRPATLRVPLNRLGGSRPDRIVAFAIDRYGIAGSGARWQPGAESAKMSSERQGPK
ncbi:MAG: family 10 glycosylhydrolase, partial [Betaproteobacteria bacterium]